MLERLGAVQLDTISVLARSHELVPYARLGAVSRGAIEAAYWGGGSRSAGNGARGAGNGAGGVGRVSDGGYRAFEYWAHAASVIPMADWPLFAFRRRAYLRRGWRWHKVPEGVCDEIRDRLKADGPLTTASRPSWSPVPDVPSAWRRAVISPTTTGSSRTKWTA